MSARAYVVNRLLQVVPVVLTVIVVNFCLIRLAPGDPATILAGEQAGPQAIAAIREKYRLDQPLPAQLARYLAGVATGDLGYSYAFRQPVLDLILSRLPATLLLVLTSQCLGVVFGVVLGAVSARFRGSWLDTLLTLLAALAYSLPVFWLGLLLIIGFGITLHWFPTSGMVGILAPTSGPGRWLDILWHLVLPVASLTLVWVLPTFLRITRASVIDVLGEAFVTTARAKGLSERAVYYRHALRNALLPVVTVLGLNLGLALSGALLTETVFAWPGLGRLMYDAIFQRDYPLLMGLFLFTSIGVVLATLATDLCYRAIDPRIELA